MNKNGSKSKTNDTMAVSPMQFRLIGVNFTDISSISWRHRDLKARFWRLYQHNISGGGIVLNGKYTGLNPDHIYLIPPDVQFASRTAVFLTQLNIHFEIAPFHGSGNAPFFSVEITPEAQRLLDLCRKHYDEKAMNALRLAAVTLTTYCLSLLPEGSLEQKYESDFQVTKLCSSIKNMYREPVSVDSMMKTTGFGSKSVLTRKFKEKTGTTPYHFLLRHRYEYAAELLRTRDYTLGEICEFIGVNDTFHFSRTFKKIHGISPSEYRCKKNNA